MPLFDYIGPGGEVREMLHATGPDVLELGGVPWQRVRVQRFTFAGSAPVPTMGSEVLRGYRDEERARGARFRTLLPADTIKRVWANDRGAIGDES